MTVDNEEIKNEEEQKTEEDKSALDVLSEGMENLFEDKPIDAEEKQDETKDEDLEDKDKQLESEDSDSEKESDGEKKAETDDSHKGEKDLIPQEQVDIARKLGWSDERIIKTAEDTPEELKKMVELLSKPDPTQRELPKVEVPKEEKKVTPKLDHIKLDDLGELEPESAKAVSVILKAHNSLIDRTNKQTEQLESLGEQTSTIEKRSQDEAMGKIDSFFDTASEHLPELGKVGSLTPDQSKARTEVYGIATIFQRTRGVSERQALEDATYLFGLGKIDLDTIEQEAENRVKEKLNKQKKKMSPRPGGKKKVEKPEIGRDAALDHLSQGMKEILG